MLTLLGNDTSADVATYCSLLRFPHPHLMQKHDEAVVSASQHHLSLIALLLAETLWESASMGSLCRDDTREDSRRMAFM